MALVLVVRDSTKPVSIDKYREYRIELRDSTKPVSIDKYREYGIEWRDSIKPVSIDKYREYRIEWEQNNDVYINDVCKIFDADIKCKLYV